MKPTSLVETLLRIADLVVGGLTVRGDADIGEEAGHRVLELLANVTNL